MYGLYWTKEDDPTVGMLRNPGRDYATLDVMVDSMWSHPLWAERRAAGWRVDIVPVFREDGHWMC